MTWKLVYLSRDPLAAEPPPEIVERKRLTNAFSRARRADPITFSIRTLSRLANAWPAVVRTEIPFAFWVRWQVRKLDEGPAEPPKRGFEVRLDDGELPLSKRQL